MSLEKGLKGEKLVELDLFLGLDRREYTTYANLTFEVLDGTTQVDFLVVSRFGLFVIEVKNYSGYIFGTERQKQWTQVLNRNCKYRFQNPLHQNYRHMKCLESLLGVDESLFRSVVVFTGNCEFKSDMPGNVIDGSVSKHIRKQRNEPALSIEQTRALRTILSFTMLPQNEETDETHLRSLTQRHLQVAA